MGEQRAAGTAPDQSLGKREAKEQVVVSYAWNPPARPGETGIPAGYEEPVDAIEKFLKDKPVIFVRDKAANKFGDNLRTFMEYLGKQDHVIVVHSDKYWRSPFCIFELWTVDHDLRLRADKSLLKVVIPVEHLNSRITTEQGLRELLDYWTQFSPANTPTMLGWETEKLKDHARALLRDFAEDLGGCLDLNLKWSDGVDKVLHSIAQRLDLPPKKTHE